MQAETSLTEANPEAHFFFGNCKQHCKLSSEVAFQIISSFLCKYSSNAERGNAVIKVSCSLLKYRSKRTELSNTKVTFL